MTAFANFVVVPAPIPTELINFDTGTRLKYDASMNRTTFYVGGTAASVIQDAGGTFFNAAKTQATTL